jgi:hypothetical protein
LRRIPFYSRQSPIFRHVRHANTLVLAHFSDAARSKSRASILKGTVAQKPACGFGNRIFFDFFYLFRIGVHRSMRLLAEPKNKRGADERTARVVDSAGLA